jgi:hypothetical protein
MWDFVMNKSDAGARFLRELRFPLPIYIPSASPQTSSLSPEAGTIGQEWPQRQWPHKPNKKKPYFGPGSNPGLVMWDFVMDKSGAGEGFLRGLRFPLPIIPPISPLS